jgi:hypothetical protein
MQSYQEVENYNVLPRGKGKEFNHRGWKALLSGRRHALIYD